MRHVCHYREPIRDPAEPITELDIDLVKLSHAAAKETLLTRVHMPGWVALFEDLLVSGTRELRWRSDGLGIGRELRRSFSNIFGRFLARYYLQEKETVLELLPIEGDKFRFSPNMRVEKKAGENGDMPDWIGWTSTGLVIAEAKGSHDGSSWHKQHGSNKREPAPVKKAREQVERAKILHTGKSGSEREIQFKGWAVASRWATENNECDPWLVAIDPEFPGAEFQGDEFIEVTGSLQASLNRNLAEAMGFPPGDLDRSIFPVNIEGAEVHVDAGIHALVGPMGFIPIQQPGELLTLYDFLYHRMPLALVSLSKPALFGDTKVYTAEPQRVPSGFSRAGFSVHFLTERASPRASD